MSSQEIVLRSPESEDGMSVFKLVKQCPPLDINSVYCNLLQCSHFSGTSVAAERAGELLGFISGYLVPGSNDTLFIWQVAVSEKTRGEGLASRMIRHILDRELCQQVSFIETTITEDNLASWALFKSLAVRLGAEINHSKLFDRDRHFDDEHDSEILVRIGPFNH